MARVGSCVAVCVRCVRVRVHVCVRACERVRVCVCLAASVRVHQQ